MGGIERSWALLGASWHVLRAEKGLLLFPALSGICTLFALAVFAVPAIGLMIATGGRREHVDLFSDPVSLILLFGFYLVTSFVTLFFNTALVGTVLEGLRGGRPRTSTGFEVALRHLPAIFVYALISATVGVALRLIEEKLEIVGQLVGGLLGAGWGIVTFLVVPVMVAEDRSPFAAIGRSKDLLAQTWGAQIGGNLGMGLIFTLLGILGLIPATLGVISGTTPLLVAGFAVALIYWGLLAVVASALSQIFRTAVYLYAATGNVPAEYERWMLESAFKAKR